MLPSSFIDTHTGQSRPIHYPPAFQLPPESSALSSHRPTPQLFLTSMWFTANFVSEAEQCGAHHVAEAEGLFGWDELISDDNWDTEEEDTDDVSNVESSTTPTVDENDPDPFCYKLETIECLPSVSDVHPNCVVYIIYLLVLWMNTQFHLPFQACNAFLIVVGLAFEAAGVIIDPPMFTSGGWTDLSNMSGMSQMPWTIPIYNFCQCTLYQMWAPFVQTGPGVNGQDPHQELSTVCSMSFKVSWRANCRTISYSWYGGQNG